MTEKQKDKIVQIAGEWKFCYKMMDVFEEAALLFKKSDCDAEFQETMVTFDKWDNLRLQKEKELLDLL